MVGYTFADSLRYAVICILCICLHFMYASVLDIEIPHDLYFERSDGWTLMQIVHLMSNHTIDWICL